MKKSKVINLVLLTTLVSSCKQPNSVKQHNKKVFMRSDSTASYSYASRSVGKGLYFAFRPYGSIQDEMTLDDDFDLKSKTRYKKAGYYSGAISENSNIGSNGTKGGIIRGGFGGSTYSVGA